MTSSRRRERGFSLIEFMIAGTLSLLVLAALTTAFVSNSRTRDEIERATQQIENGRYSAQVLYDDLEVAGFMGQLDQYCATCTGLNFYYVAGTVVPDPCATAVADLRVALPFYIQGIDQVKAATTPSCISDVKEDTDVVVVRRASTCVSGTTNCAAVAGAPYFQASLCNDGAELANTAAYDPANPAKFALDTNTANLTKHKKDCTTLAEMRRYLVHIYYIAKNDQAGDGIPTLKRAELDYGKTVCPTHDASGKFCIVSIAEGVEELHMEYGVDYDADGQPDVSLADPSNPNGQIPGGKPGAACPGTALDCAKNWMNVVSVKVNLLVRSTTSSPDLAVTDKKYVLGLKADGQPNPFGPYSDKYKRHVFHSSIWLNNPAARRAS